MVTNMHLYRGLHNLPALASDGVITIGNFDGVHLGHQAILEQVRNIAVASQHKSIVLMFEPQPLEFFRGKEAPVRLTRLREKLVLIKQFNIDYVVCLTFNQALSRMSPEKFVSEILLDKLKAKSVIVGEDFRYGRRRSAGLSELVESGRNQGFDVYPAKSISINEQRVSSSWVRETLAEPDLDAVYKLLGRDYSLCGRVIHGDQRGRQLGFPTANVSLERNVSPVRGVFATSVILNNQERIRAVTNIGQRPVFGGGPMLLESYCLDRDIDLYGQLITVEIHKHLRDEQKFDSIAALKDQIAADVVAARDYFQNKT